MRPVARVFFLIPRGTHVAPGSNVLRLLAGRIALGVALLVPEIASAQSKGEPDRNAGAVVVRVRPQASGLSYRVRALDESGAQPVSTCTGSCVLYLLPGRYSLELFDHGRSMGKRTLRVQQDATWSVAPQNRTLKWVGLGGGIAGPIAIVASGPLIFGSHDSATPGKIGAGLILGGIFLTTVGWILYADNVRPSVDTMPSRQEAWLRRLRVGATPTRGGASFSAGLRF